MGFGILFFGYFVMFAFSLSQMYFFADIIGAVIAIFAFSKLSEYNKYFRYAMLSGLIFTVFCALNAASMMFKLYSPNGIADIAVDVLKALSAAVMHVYIFIGARGISLGAESEKLAKNAERNLTMTMIYYASYIIITLLRTSSHEMMQYFKMVILIYWLVCIILNLVFIYKCFGILCPADENENEKKRSRFAFINKIDDKMDEFEKNNQKYRLESMKMAQDEADRLALEKSRKSKKHKKKK